MERKFTEPSCLVLLLGIPQIVGCLQTAVVASMLAEGFVQFILKDLENTYVTWYFICVGVTLISIALIALDVLYIYANNKPSHSALEAWMLGMMIVCVAQALMIFAVPMAILCELWTCPRETCPQLVPAIPNVELDRWRISLSQEPVRRVTYLLCDQYGAWLLYFGVYWCCVLCVHLYQLWLISNLHIYQDHLDSENESNSLPNIYVDCEENLETPRHQVIQSKHQVISYPLDTKVQKDYNTAPIIKYHSLYTLLISNKRPAEGVNWFQVFNSQNY